MPQYAEDTFSPEECKKIPNEYIDLMFAGNIGSAQSVDTIIKAAALCKNITNLRWHIVGDGKELDNCKKLSKELNAPVTFYGRKPIEEMPKYYAMADAMLITMKKDPIVSLTLPGKVQSYMAAGKTIIGSIDGEAFDVINEAKCGLCVSAENEVLLAQCIKKIAEDKEKLNEYAKNSLVYYQQHFSKNQVISSQIEEI